MRALWASASAMCRVVSGPAVPVMLGNTFDHSTGVILEGTIRLPAAKTAPRRGFYIEYEKDKKGSAVLVDASGRAELGSLSADGTGFKVGKKVVRQMKFGAPARFRLLLRGVLLEIYLDDIMIECFSLPRPATGRIGLIGGSKGETFGALKAWR